MFHHVYKQHLVSPADDAWYMSTKHKIFLISKASRQNISIFNFCRTFNWLQESVTLFYTKRLTKISFNR